MSREAQFEKLRKTYFFLMQRQPRNSENVPLVAHRRKHFQGFLVVLFCCLTHFKNPYFMMIISFIAVKDGLVP